jgi:hypothetical protein
VQQDEGSDNDEYVSDAEDVVERPRPRDGEDVTEKLQPRMRERPGVDELIGRYRARRGRYGE